MGYSEEELNNARIAAIEHARKNQITMDRTGRAGRLPPDADVTGFHKETQRLIDGGAPPGEPKLN